MKPKMVVIKPEQIDARDEIVKYVKERIDLIVNNRLKEFIKRAQSGELEAIEELSWDWCISIKGKELEDLKELVRKMRWD